MELLITTAITALISSAVGALVGALVSKIKTSTVEARDMREMQIMNLKMTCRMAIYDEHFTTDEKIDAYIVYRDKCHGNHQTKKYMDELVGCDIDEYIEKHKKD